MAWEAIALPIVMSLAVALTALIAMALRKYGKFIDSKVDNEYFNRVLKQTVELVARVVKETQQVVVDELKEDGKWTKETAADVKKAALDKIKEYLGEKGLKELADVFGLTDGTLLDELIGSFIEAQVKDLP